MQLYEHQQKFLNDNPDRAMLAWDTGLGKTFTCVLWLKKRIGKKLVICPKIIKKEWQEKIAESNVDADVLTKEEIKKYDISKYDVLIVDEALFFASPLFGKGRSQMATVLYNHIRKKPGTNVLLATATPVSSTPWNAHSLLTYIDHFIPVKQFRDLYFSLEAPPYMKGRYISVPKKNWRVEIRDLLYQQRNIYIASLADFVKDMPEEFHEEIKVKLSKDTEQSMKALESDIEIETDMKLFVEQHKKETGKEKIKQIRIIAQGFKKVILVAKYKDTIAMLEKELSKDREVFVVTGETKDQDFVVRQANNSFECYMIIQSQIAAGFELPLFPATIFVQQGYKYSDFVQMKGRNRRVNSLHDNYYYYLIAGKRDKQVHKTLMAGLDLDFNKIKYE